MKETKLNTERPLARHSMLKAIMIPLPPKLFFSLLYFQQKLDYVKTSLQYALYTQYLINNLTFCYFVKRILENDI